jgi:hypothetical protein
MHPLIRILLHSLRHAAIGAAVLAVLMTAFQIHGPSCDEHAHPGHAVTAISLDDAAPDQPRTDSDGCTCCICPPSDALPTDACGLALPIQMVAVAHVTLTAIAPDGRSYPPDPPPVRLS